MSDHNVDMGVRSKKTWTYIYYITWWPVPSRVTRLVLRYSQYCIRACSAGHLHKLQEQPYIPNQIKRCTLRMNHYESTYQNGKEDGRVLKNLEQVQSKGRLRLHAYKSGGKESSELAKFTIQTKLTTTGRSDSTILAVNRGRRSSSPSCSRCI